MISVASPVFPKMKFKYKNEEYAQRCVPQFDFPSIHLQGTKDQYNADVTIEQLFKKEANPVVVVFEEGHKFPRKRKKALWRRPQTPPSNALHRSVQPARPPLGARRFFDQ